MNERDSMRAMVAKAVRQALFVVGGALGSKGAVNESDVEVITAALMIVGSLAWSWFNVWREKKQAARLAGTLGVAVLGLALVGCGSVAPGSDPVVVYAERTTLVSMDTIDAFLRFERANEAALGAKVHGIAESLRKQAPKALRAARTATKTYKANRNAENKATLETALAVLQELANQALAATPKPAAKLRASGMAAAAVPAGVLLGIEALAAILALIAKERERLRQNGELTPEQDAQIDDEIDEVLNQEHWQPGRGLQDKPPG